MAVSNLNVRVGFLFDEKGLKQIERQMRSAGQRLSNLGNQLTTTISLPLAAIGVAAIKSAGDLEALQLALRATFEGAGRSAAEADAELQKLRQSALAPGLDFEQAVRASVRLQNVGFQAEKAREVIEQLANAVATTGGTAQDLDEVTQQFSQMIGKGKIFQDDLKIILGRMPLLARIMKDTFGTTTAEGLNALGVDARTFVDTITKEMANLPRVSGGIANSIVNTLAALKNAAATLGLSLNKAFDITGKLDAFAAGVTFIADAFSSLNPTLQATIGWVAALFFAIGPLTSAVGILKTNWATLVGVVGTLQKAVQGAIVAFRALSLAEKATVIGAIVSVVLAAAAAFYEWSNSMSQAEQVTQSLEKANIAAADSIVEEKLRAEALIGVLKDQNATRGQQKAALNELKAISPEYFGRLDLEKVKVTDLDKALENYVGSLLRAAKAQAAFEQIKELEKTKNNVNELAKPSIWQNIQNGGEVAIDIFKRFNNASGFIREGINAFRGAEDAFNPLVNAQKELANDFQANKDKIVSSADAQIAALQEVIKANTELADATESGAKKGGKSIADFKSELDNLKAQFEKTAVGTKEFTDLAAQIKSAEANLAKLEGTAKGNNKTTKDSVTWVDAYLDSLNKAKAAQDKMRQAMDAMGIGRLDTLPQAGTGGVTSQAAPVTPQIATVGTTLAAALTPAQALFQALNTQVLTFNEAFSLLAENVVANGSLMQQSLLGIAESAMAFAEAGGASIGGFVNSLVEGAKKAVGAYIRIGVAAVVAKALASSGLNPFAALAAGAIAGAAAQTLFNGILSKIKIPEFAKGTNFAPGGLALVGEQGPELVNLPRGSQVTPNAATNALLSQNAADITLTHRISGSDLLFIVRRAAAQERRAHGLLGLRGI